MVQQKKTKEATKAKQEEATVEAKDVKNEELEAQVDSTLDAIDEVLSDDEILDDIDDILEVDAQAFVDGFIQKGGE